MRFHSFNDPSLVQWDSARAVQYIRDRGMTLAIRAVKEGWHTHLVHFVACRHVMPAGEDLTRVIENAQKVDKAIANFQGPELKQIKANRERIANDLTAARAAAE